MSRPRRSRPATSLRRGRRLRVSVASVLVAVAAVGCALPTTDPPASDADPAEDPIGSSTPDPARVALLEELELLVASVASARDELAVAVDAERLGDARAAADAALDRLIAPSGAGAETDGPRPLFPSEPGDRVLPEDAADQLTWTLTRARDVGGTLGNTVVDVLRDPIAGDLGAWQRDAPGVLAGIDAALTDARTPEERQATVAELAGIGTRAIAWARLAERAGTADEARDAAERGVAHLEVIVHTLEGLELDP